MVQVGWTWEDIIDSVRTLSGTWSSRGASSMFFQVILFHHLLLLHPCTLFSHGHYSSTNPTAPSSAFPVQWQSRARLELPRLTDWHPKLPQLAFTNFMASQQSLAQTLCSVLIQSFEGLPVPQWTPRWLRYKGPALLAAHLWLKVFHHSHRWE